MSKSALWVVVGLAVVASTAFGHSAYRYYLAQAVAENRIAADPASTPVNQGPFTLVDHTGRVVTDQSFRGEFMLVFFGYTFCPDVCPTTLMDITTTMDLLGEQAERVRPIFITVDPERDTVETLAEYVSNFHPRLVGLTGTRDQVAAATKVYRVHYQKYYPLVLNGDDESETEASDDEENAWYLMNHTASIYLVGPDGGGLSLYPHGITPQQIVEDIQRFIDSSP